MSTVIEEPLNIKVRISDTRMVEVDLFSELNIDLTSVTQEVLAQPSKYATWAVLSDLAEQSVSSLYKELAETSMRDINLDSIMSRISVAEKKHEFFSSVRNVFSHRKSVLLKLWGNPEQPLVLKAYEQDISHLRALIKDIVPLISPQ